MKYKRALKTEKFADFAEEQALDGDKIKIDEVLNLEIAVTGFKISGSRFAKSNSSQCLKLQFELEGKKRILFSGSDVLIEQIKKYESHIPFLAKITKIDKYYSFS